MLEKFSPDVIKTVEEIEKFIQEKGYWPGQKEWNDYAVQYGFFSAGTLMYWGLWDYLQRKHRSECKIIKEVSRANKTKKIIGNNTRETLKNTTTNGAIKETINRKTREPIENTSKTKTTLIGKQLAKEESVTLKKREKREKRKGGTGNIWSNANETNLRRIRRSLMPVNTFLKLTGLSKTKLCEIELGISYISEELVEFIAGILNTTSEIIAEGLLVWDKDRPLPFWKKDKTDKFDKTRKVEIVSNNKISPIQKAILDFIRDFPHQYPPTVREISAGVGLNSSSSVQYHIDKLEQQGYIDRRANSPRCIVLSESRL